MGERIEHVADRLADTSTTATVDTPTQYIIPSQTRTVQVPTQVSPSSTPEVCMAVLDALAPPVQFRRTHCIPLLHSVASHKGSYRHSCTSHRLLRASQATTVADRSKVI